ncbi:MAG: ECF transporter S component [Actinomycetaceae bacterium]|nr:ECF transporter S component [Actinomycetaceae bacterium]
MSSTHSSKPKIHSAKKGGLQNTVLGTRNLMMVAAIAVIGSIIVTPIQYLSIAAATSLKGAFLLAAIMGLWVIPYLLPAAIIKKPGATIISSFIIGVIISLTTPVGFAGIPGSMFGAIIALPLVITLYKNWSWPVFLACALWFSGLFGSLTPMAYKIDMSIPTIALLVALSMCSGAVGFLICMGIEKAARRTGIVE